MQAKDRELAEAQWQLREKVNYNPKHHIINPKCRMVS